MRYRRTARHRRHGNILVLTALMMVGLLAMIAFSLDIGYLVMARNQAQRSADAAAIAAAWELVGDSVSDDEDDEEENNDAMRDAARERAEEFAALNRVCTASPDLGQDDVQVGRISNPSSPAVNVANSARPNAVRVVVQRTDQQNGEVPLFFARVLGMDRAAVRAEATAMLIDDIKGFKTPSDGSNLNMLPFALDKESWDQLVGGNGGDDWAWDEAAGEVRPGGDGILELNMYPQGTGSPGNRGTVDIGSSSNSTADLARQITQGVSSQDLEYHGGSLEFDANGELKLNADTGISAGLKDELEQIKGRPEWHLIDVSVMLRPVCNRL